MDLFWRRGYASTSVRELERALDLTAPAIYHRFGSKQALFERALDHYVATIVVPRIAAYLVDTGDPVVNLYRFYRTAQSELGCVLTNTGVDEAQPPSVRTRVHAGVETMRRAIADQLARASEAGTLRADPERTSHALIVAMHGLMAMARTGEPEAVRGATRAVFAAIFPDHPGFGQG